VHSLTYTWSRNPSIRDAPAWTTHTQRVHPGEAIIVNRDEDGEAGDLGIRRVSPDGESSYGKEVTLSGSGSGSERQDEAHGQEHGHADGEHAARDAADEEGGRTPPIAEYREGDHLVIERTNKETGEVSMREIELTRSTSRLSGITIGKTARAGRTVSRTRILSRGIGACWRASCRRWRGGRRTRRQ
jgi:hypothetical protein